MARVLFGAGMLVAATLGGCATATSGSGSPDAGRDDASTGNADGAIDGALDAAVMSCAGTDACQGAMMLGTVSGDSQNQKLTAAGYRGAWYRVRVTEDNSGVGGLSLRVAAKLTSPATPMFDVFVYVNSGSDAIECSTT